MKFDFKTAGIVNIAQVVGVDGASSPLTLGNGSTTNIYMPSLALLSTGYTVNYNPSSKALSYAASGGGGGGTITGGANLGGGQGVFANVTGATMNFNTLVAGANVALSTGTNTIVIAATVPVTGLANEGAGSGIFDAIVSGTANLKSLVAGANVSVTPSSTAITISATVPVTAVANEGSGSGLFDAIVSGTANFKSLVAGSGVAITSQATTLTVANSGVLSLANEGGGNAIFDSTAAGVASLRTLVAGTGISITQGATTVTITNSSAPVSAWELGGNSLSGTSQIGSTTDEIVQLIANSVVFAEFDPTSGSAIFTSSFYTVSATNTCSITALETWTLDSPDIDIGVVDAVTIDVGNDTNATALGIAANVTFNGSANTGSFSWSVPSNSSAAIQFEANSIQIGTQSWSDTLNLGRAGNTSTSLDGSSLSVGHAGSGSVNVLSPTVTMANIPNTSQTNLLGFNSGSGAVTYVSASSIIGANAWLITGNTGTGGSGQLGTIDPFGWSLVAGNNPFLTVDGGGSVGFTTDAFTITSLNFQVTSSSNVIIESTGGDVTHNSDVGSLFLQTNTVSAITVDNSQNITADGPTITIAPTVCTVLNIGGNVGLTATINADNLLLTGSHGVLIDSSGTGEISIGTSVAGEFITLGTPTASFWIYGNDIELKNLAGSAPAGSLPVLWDPTGKALYSGSGSSAASWQNVTASTQAMAVNSYYTAAYTSGTLAFTLPASANYGDVFAVAGAGYPWILNANTGQVINYLATPTSSGGSIASSGNYDAIFVVCLVANTTFMAYSSQTAEFVIS